ncbi:hypothetical protein LOTGIDRAFT_239759, partial [Lottia gigantea]
MTNVTKPKMLFHQSPVFLCDLEGDTSLQEKKTSKTHLCHGNTNKNKPKSKIQRRALDSSSSDEKDEVIVISPSVNLPSPEDSQTARRKKRKTRAERNKTSGLSKSNKTESKSNVAKHISTTQTLTNAGEHSKENDTSLSKISNTRLT